MWRSLRSRWRRDRMRCANWRLPRCGRRGDMRCGLRRRRSRRVRWHLCRGWRDMRRSLRSWWRCGRSNGRRRRLLCGRRGDVRCALGSGWSRRVRWRLNGRRRRNGMHGGRRCHAFRRFCDRGRCRWLRGGWRWCDGGSFCRGGRLRRYRFRLLLRFRLRENDHRLAGERGVHLSGCAVRNAGFGHRDRRDTGKHRAGHEQPMKHFHCSCPVWELSCPPDLHASASGHC
jgi:hypothetical protein